MKLPSIHIGSVNVAAFGSNRHARELREGRNTAHIRNLIAAYDTVTADTSAGLRRLIVRRCGRRMLVFTRMPKAVQP